MYNQLQDLTSRYGSYLLLSLSTPPDPAQEAAAAAFVSTLCASARRVYSLGGTQTFELPKADASLRVVFHAMTSAKQRSQDAAAASAPAAAASLACVSPAAGATLMTSQQTLLAPLKPGAAGGGSADSQPEGQLLQPAEADDFASGGAGRGSSGTTPFTLLDWGVTNASLEQVFVEIARDAGAVVTAMD